MYPTLNQSLPSLNKNLWKSSSVKLLTHLGWLFLGVLVFAAIILNVNTFRSALQAWYSTRSLEHSIELSLPTVFLALIAFVVGSWSVGRTLAHVIGLLVRRFKTIDAPN